MADDNELLTAALSYAARGWPVFPIAPLGKTPMIPNGFKGASTDVATIRAWWARWPNANIGLPTGEVSGVIVIDIDPKHNGHHTFEGLESLHGSPPSTVRCSTQSGGTHWYFRNRKGFRNTAGQLGKGIDTRGEGGYVVAPTSIGQTGALYEWVDGCSPDDVELAEIPDWLIPGAIPPQQLAAGNLNLEVKPAATDPTSPVVEGNRNNAATSLAGKWIAEGNSLHGTRRLLDGWNKTQCKPPLPSSELDTIVASVTNTHVRNNPAKPVPVTDQPVVVSPAAPAKTLRPFPSHLLAPSGLVGDIAAYINSTAIKAQPAFALATALAFVGAVVGRKVQTPTGLRTNLYVLGVGASGCGKDHSRKMVKRICDAAGLTEQILGGEEVSSDAAIMAAVTKQPSVLFLLDEIGHMLSAANSKLAPAHMKAIAPTLTKLFSSADTKLLGKSYAHAERVDIDQPNACMYGTTVAERLYSGLTPDEIRDGFLGRLLVFVSDDADPEERMIKPKPVPEGIVQQVQAWWGRTDLPRAPGNIAGVTTHIPMTVDFEPAASAVMEGFRRTCREMKAKTRDGSGVDALWARAMEHASKLALTVACGTEYSAPVISRDVAAWSVAVVEHVIDALVEAVRNSVSSTEYGRDQLRVYQIIAKGGAAGVNRSRIYNALGGIPTTALDKMLNDLMLKEKIAAKPSENKTGKKTLVYYAIAPAE